MNNRPRKKRFGKIEQLETRVMLDGDPTFDPSSYVFDIPRDYLASDQVGTVQATDDNGIDSYNLYGTGLFTINYNGEISLSGDGALLIYNAGDSVIFDVEALDAESNSAIAQVTVNILDAIDPPVFDSASYSFSPPEDTEGEIGTVYASDGGGMVSYSLINDPSGLFSIDSMMGTITVNSGALVGSSGQTFDFQIEAMDDLGITAIADVTINVGDAADPPVFDSADYTFDVAEDTDGDIGTVSASDGGNMINYTLMNDPSGLFSIDSMMGTITVNSGALVGSSGQMFDFQVKATDDMGITAIANVTVSVGDAADPPVFDSPSYTFTPIELAEGTIGTVTATDGGGSVSYALVNDPSGLFSIDSNGNVSVTCGSLRGFIGQFGFNVQATDNVGISSLVAVLVDVQPAPVVSFVIPSQTPVVAEGNELTFTVQVTGTFTEQIQVNYATSGMTGGINATPGTAATASTHGTGDFVAVTDGVVTFEVGETTKTITIQTRDDANVEVTEGLSVWLATTATNAIVDSTKRSVLAGISSDDKGVISISSTGASALENTSGTLDFSILLEIAGGGTIEEGASIEVRYATADGNDSDPDNNAVAVADYIAKTAIAVFGVGSENGATETASVTLVNDTVPEANEQVRVTLTEIVSGPGELKVGATTASGTILNNDVVLTFTTTTGEPDIAVSEGADSVTFHIHADGTLNGLTLRTSGATNNGSAHTGGTEEGEDDYVAITDDVRTFGNGNPLTQTISITIKEDTEDEGDETFLYKIVHTDGSSPELEIGFNHKATITIIDND